jgi:hypothetical protein
VAGLLVRAAQVKPAMVRDHQQVLAGLGGLVTEKAFGVGGEFLFFAVGCAQGGFDVAEGLASEPGGASPDLPVGTMS